MLSAILPDLEKLNKELKHVAVYLPKLKERKEDWIENCVNILDNFLNTYENTEYVTQVDNIKYQPFVVEFEDEASDEKYMDEIIAILSQRRGEFMLNNKDIKRF